ncbi:MAG: IS110 family transposase [Actinomycetota bacterium]
MEVAIGIDPAKGSLAVAAVDALGRVLEAVEFPNDPRGHRALLGWVRERGLDRVIGIECSLSYGASLSRYLLGAGEDVREVPTTLTHRERRRRHSQGKSDLVDSVAIARIVASGEVLPSAHRIEMLTDLRALVDYRDQLVRARTQMANRAHADLVNIRPGYGGAVPNLRAKVHRAKARSLLRGDRSVRAELLRRRLGELSRLEGEIAPMDRRIEATVRETGTSLTEIPGVGPFVAAKILGEVGDPSRIRSKAAFAVLSGTAPLPASSGQTHRHRLNRGGNRQLNWALHYIALVQCRVMPEAQAYMARQREGGKSHKEATRCLKRHLSNVVYRHLVADSRSVEVAP